VGGAAKHVALLERGLSDWESRLFAGPPRAMEGDFWALHALESHATWLPSLRREASPARDLRALRDLVRRFRSFKPHIVDTHLSKAGILGRLAARICGVPVSIHTFHVNIFDGYNWNTPERAIYLRLERWSARWSDALICLAPELGEQLQALGIGETAQWRPISLGIDLAPFRASTNEIEAARRDLRRELGISASAPIVGLVSRLAPVKSVKTFLEAAAQIHQTRPDVHVVLVGDGESRARLQSLARDLKLENHAHFLGLRADIARLNWAFDAVALSSLQEGTPISLMESLAAGKPVVATDVGGVGRLIEHERTGVLVPPRDSAALAHALQHVLEAPEAAQQMGERGREKMNRERSLERMIDEHRALYLELLRARQLI
jgi:glycosyltransferase involved in cell wall biosynthesis